MSGPNLKVLKLRELDLLIARHEEKAATDKPLYTAAKTERARREGSGLDIETTIDHLIQCARRRAFTTYSAVAQASGVEWNRAYRPMRNHLETILQVCEDRGWPLLSAICVKQEEAKTGELSGDSLSGFIAGVERVRRIKIDKPSTFLKRTQRECFDWAMSR